MRSKSLQYAVFSALLALPLRPADASNPHTVDGQDCSAWLPTAPLSERVRQVRACENFQIANAMKLAQEFDTGSNGLTSDWGQAATWYRETLQLARGVSKASMGARRAEAAQQRLSEMLVTGGPGLARNLAEAQRLMPVNISPGYWEFTTRVQVNGQEVAIEDGGRQALCITADDLPTTSPFALAAVHDNYLAMGCEIEQVRMGVLDAEVSVDCETFYDDDWDETFGQLAKLMVKYQGETAEIAIVATAYPEGAQTTSLTTARRLRAC